jgi:hypothetical protein
MIRRFDRMREKGWGFFSEPWRDGSEEGFFSFRRVRNHKWTVS